MLNLPYLLSDTLFDIYSHTTITTNSTRYYYQNSLNCKELFSFVILRLFFSFFEQHFFKEPTQLGIFFFLQLGRSRQTASQNARLYLVMTTVFFRTEAGYYSFAHLLSCYFYLKVKFIFWTFLDCLLLEKRSRRFF